MKPRTVQGCVVKVGDELTRVGTTDSRFRCKVSRVDNETGMVQYVGDNYHWYTPERCNQRHVYEDE